MNAQSKTLVVAGGARTPIGHISRSLAGLKADELMVDATLATLARARLSKEAVDGLIVGWVGQDFFAPNIARVSALRAGLPEKTQAVTVQNNCVSSIEAISAAGRSILAGEGELYVAGGVEVMSRLSYAINGSRKALALRNLDTVKKNWSELLATPDVAVIDTIEQGLTDPIKKINMAGTAEVCAQMYGISRAEQDEYAQESFRRCLEGWRSGFYASHVAAVTRNGQALLEKDEYPHLREDLVVKPQMLAKAPALFDNSFYPIKDFFRDYGHFIEGKSYVEGQTQGTVTLFNSCSRSDGAAAVIITTEEKANSLCLDVLAEIKGWGFYGNNPVYLGVSPAWATSVALERSGISFDALDQIELHEPFAATTLSIFKFAREKFGHDWAAKQDSGALNPHGGSIALGHPLGATGARLMLNLVHALRKNPKGRYGLLAGCAGGGIGAAMVVERR